VPQDLSVSVPPGYPNLEALEPYISLHFLSPMTPRALLGFCIAVIGTDRGIPGAQ
jgi:hypothetical protein